MNKTIAEYQAERDTFRREYLNVGAKLIPTFKHLNSLIRTFSSSDEDKIEDEFRESTLMQLEVVFSNLSNILQDVSTNLDKEKINNESR